MRARSAMLAFVVVAAIAGCRPDAGPVTADPSASPRYDGGGGWLGGGGKALSDDSTEVAGTVSDTTTVPGDYLLP